MAKLTCKQLTNNLDSMSETINRKIKAIKALIRADCIEKAIVLSMKLSYEAEKMKEILMDYDIQD